MTDDDILSRHWFIISAAPSRGHDAADLLRSRNAIVFQPMAVKAHRPNHHAKRRWRSWQPVMGRYLIAGFTDYTPPWLTLLDHSSIAQVVDYRPVQRKTMLDLILEYGAIALKPPPRRRVRTSAEEITEGCDAVVLSGLYYGQTARVDHVIKPRRGPSRAAVLLPFLNSSRLIELPLEELERQAA